jgi:hypothetical protein
MSALESLIDRYSNGGTLLVYAAGGLTLEQERARPGPGAWSIAELVAHLADSDLVAANRMKWVLAEPEPGLLNMEETAWVERLRYQEIPVEEAVNLFAANRHWMTRILRGCSEAEFARAGHHSVRGRVTLAELVTTYVNHLDHHLRYLYAKRANLGVSLEPRYSDPTY